MSLPLDPELVRSYLQRVTASPEFASAPRLARFLTFVVEISLAGNSERIKESVIAIEVYGRKPDYNPQIDSTVRVEAGRLRARLRQYYATTGSADQLEFVLPKGTYAPLFQQRAETVSAEPLNVSPPAGKWFSRVILATAILTVISAAVLLAFTRSEAPVDSKTMELYHRANELLRIPVLKDGVPEALPVTVVESVRLFEEVTQRSPQFAKGWTGLAEAAEWEYELRGNRPPERLMQAKAAGLRAVKLEPDSAEAWTRLTSILFFRAWDLRGAEAASRRALELNPRHTAARQRYIDLLHITGRTAEAQAEIERAIQMLPAAADLRVQKAKMLYQAGRSDEAIREAEAAEKLTNQMPVYPIALAIHGLALEQKGEVTAAEKILRAALAIQPHHPWNEPALGHLLARTGRKAEAEAILAELRSQGERGRKSHVAAALVSTGLGRHGDALTALERGFVERDDALPSVPLDPRFKPLHSEARFQALTSRLRPAAL